MPTTTSYGSFAYAYDAALGQRFFRSVRRVLDPILKRYPSQLRTHLDIACGTGLAVDYFRSLGWRSAGVDASLTMLHIARRRSGSVVGADFAALPFRTTFSRITCLYDSFNHLRERNQLVAAFTAVRAVMNAESLFLFDMNHPDIYPEIWGMKEPFVSEGPDHHLEIATSYRRSDRTGVGLVTGWAMVESGERADIHERHEQRAWSESEITGALAESGLQPVEVIDFDPFNEAEALESEGVKLFFVCRPVPR